MDLSQLTRSSFQEFIKAKILIDDLVGISIHIKKDVLDRPGILYSLLKGFAWNNISIVDVISTFTEFIFIVRKEKAKAAFDFINDFLIWLFLYKNPS